MFEWLVGTGCYYSGRSSLFLRCGCGVEENEDKMKFYSERQVSAEMEALRLALEESSRLAAIEKPIIKKKKNRVRMQRDEKQDLEDRLAEYGIFEYAIEGDGSCQFRAISHQLYGSQEKHTEVREKIADFLGTRRHQYQHFIPNEESYDSYIKRIRKSGEWGDHLTLQAAADVFDINICLITSYPTQPFVHIYPSSSIHQQSKVQNQLSHHENIWNKIKANRIEPKHFQHYSTDSTVWLGFWAETHYTSLGSLDLFLQNQKYPLHTIHSSQRQTPQQQQQQQQHKIHFQPKENNEHHHLSFLPSSASA